MMFRNRKEQKGVAALEFAFIFPILLVLVFGIVEFGMALWRKELLTSAVREGARAGVVNTNPRKTTSEIQTVVKDYLIGVGWPSATVNSMTVPVTGAGGAAGASLVVAAIYPTSFLILSRLPLGGGIVVDGSGNVSLNASVTMRME